MKNWRIIIYILSEILPGFLLGILVFIGILLMFQVLRLTEFIIVHGVEMSVIAEMVLYMSVSFLPAILPMGLIFAILLTYGRLSSDSEIIAMKSVGIDMKSITTPAAILGITIMIISAISSFYVGPWGNRQFEVLISTLASQKVTASVREGAFAEGFYDLVVYANEVDEKEGILKNVFIYDERKEKLPLTIISKKGIVLKSKNNSSMLRLVDGSIHRSNAELYTKINFKTYDLFLSNPTNVQIKNKSPPSMKINELSSEIEKTDLDQKTLVKLSSEYHKRWSITLACFAFSLFGVGLGTMTQRRSQKVGGFVLSIILIVSYWILHIGMESVARNGYLAPKIALWIPCVLFYIAAIYSLKKIWNT